MDVQPDNIMMASKRSMHVKLIDTGSAIEINPTSGRPTRGYQPADVEFSGKFISPYTL